MKDRPSVSVVIPVRNAAETLARAVESVLGQTYACREIIIVDDASTDGSAAVARRYGAVVPISLHERVGAAGARNAGIQAAHGEWIAFLDADDEWLPEKLERQVSVIDRELRQSLIFCASEEFTADGRSLGDTFRGRPVDCSAGAWKTLLKTNFVATPTVMAPRELLLRLGGFDERLPIAEDQDMWIRLAMAGRLTYVAESLVKVHVRPESLSSFRSSDQSQYLLPMIERHLRASQGRLRRSEARAIIGERLNNAGRIALAHDDFMRGAAFLLHAGLMGYRPLSGLAAVAKAPITTLLRRLRRSMPRRQTAF